MLKNSAFHLFLLSAVKILVKEAPGLGVCKNKKEVISKQKHLTCKTS